MLLQDILYSQGFGTRRVCAGLIQQGKVTVGGTEVRDPLAPFAVTDLHFTVGGQPWTYREKAYIALNKPLGTECSRRPSAWPGIHTLLPDPLRLRPVKGGMPGVQAVGRLDQDTTGLLLLSDDGQFLHRMTSPRHHVPKVYRVTTRHALDAVQVDALLAGVVLDDDPAPVRAHACQILEPHVLSLTLTEGRYHQVKRMLAAVHNRVDALQRTAIGGLQLPSDLAEGAWCWLEASQLRLLGWPSGSVR